MEDTKIQCIGDPRNADSDAQMYFLANTNVLFKTNENLLGIDLPERFSFVLDECKERANRVANNLLNYILMESQNISDDNYIKFITLIFKNISYFVDEEKSKIEFDKWTPKDLLSIQPTKEQLEKLKILNSNNTFNYYNQYLTPYKWCQNLDNGSEKYNPLFLGRTPEEKIDLGERARAIIKSFIENENFTDIITMDGHGRTLWYLIEYIKKFRELPQEAIEYLNPTRTVNLNIYEINKVVHEWHEIFFPKREDNIDNININNQEENVFNSFLNTISNPENPEEKSYSLKPEVLKKTIIYLNFCGIQYFVEKLKTIIDLLSKLDSNEESDKYVIYVSAFYAITENIPTVNKLFSNNKNFLIVPITKRKDFLTFKLNRQNCIKLTENALIFTNPSSKATNKNLVSKDDNVEGRPAKRTKKRGGYYDKYIKYKIKYIELKKSFN
jgi:hypoxanthine phosphoribosyltransferase